MADSDPTTHMLDVPGARLYYERRGRGPLLLLIGSPMDSGGFAPLASALADRYTVVTYDPRGIANSSREDTTEDVTPAQQAEDVHRLLSALGGGPADVFGSSGGAVVGLALVTAHPDQLRTLVAHWSSCWLTPPGCGPRFRTSTTPTGWRGPRRRCRSSWPMPA
jgi:pimeloyl-ACP methyl ester carboxylesterase